MRIQCISRPRATCSLPTTGMLFSALAGDHAGVAADAGVEVDRHAPGVAVVLVAAGRASCSRRRLVAHLAREVAGRCSVLVERRRADEVAALHAPVVLRAGERVALAGLAHLERRAPNQGASLVRSA